MSTTIHERPGVYSSYDASTVVSGMAGGGTVGIVAKSTGGKAGEVYHLARYEDAAATFGAQDALSALVRLLFLNGAAAVYAVPVVADSGYPGAFVKLEEVEEISIVTCDSEDLNIQQNLRNSVAAASAARRERIAVVAGGPSETVAQLVQRAEDLNAERVVLVAPGTEAGENGAVAAAVAGAIAGEVDPAVPLGGAVLHGVTGLTAAYADSELDLLIRGGVTPLEAVGGQVSVVRGVTTRTKSGEAADRTWRELTTIRIVDDVIPAVRNALRAKFHRAKNTQQSRGAIRAQVVMELENKKSREIITGYDAVTAQPSPEDPTVCLVEFSFTVAHGLNQIWLTAHITV